MLLSVIIPVYNAELFLESCLKSILKQDFKNYEVIMIDDGSTDNSYNICYEFAQQHDNFTVKKIENGGPSNARNIGLKIAKGKYIQFIDSDDEIKGDLFKKLYLSTQENGNPDLIIYEAEKVDSKLNVIGFERLPESGLVNFKEQLSLLNAGNKSCMLHYVWNRWYCRDIIENNNLKFDISLKLGEDFVFNCDYLKYCQRVVFLKQALYQYFKRNSSCLTGSFRKDEYSRRKIMFDKLCQLYKHFNIYNECKDRLEAMEGFMALVSMKSVGLKNCSLNLDEKIEFLQSFIKSEYLNYIKKGIQSGMINKVNKLRASLLINEYYRFFIWSLKIRK